MSKQHRLAGYIAFHSFGNKILYPWGFTSDRADDWRDLKSFADVAAGAIGSSVGAVSRADGGEGGLLGGYTVTQQSVRDQQQEESSDLRRVLLGEQVLNQASQTQQGYTAGQGSPGPPDVIHLHAA